jgi:hypothetical protein
MVVDVLGSKDEKNIINNSKPMVDPIRLYLAGASANGPPKLGYRFSIEFKFKPNAVRSCPMASDTKFGSDSAALMNVSSPTIPYWLFTILAGMFVTLPGKQKT